MGTLNSIMVLSGLKIWRGKKKSYANHGLLSVQEMGAEGDQDMHAPPA